MHLWLGLLGGKRGWASGVSGGGHGRGQDELGGDQMGRRAGGGQLAGGELPGHGLVLAVVAPDVLGQVVGPHEAALAHRAAELENQECQLVQRCYRKRLANLLFAGVGALVTRELVGT